MPSATKTIEFPLIGLKGRDFLSTGDFTRSELSDLLDLAIQYKHSGHGQPLVGKTVALVFFDPSLRTRASMQIAIHQLGGYPVILDVGKGTWSLEYREGVVMDGDKTEHIKEATRVLSTYADAIAVRSFPTMKSYEEERLDPVLKGFQRSSSVPVMNLESAMFHPFQAMADVMTIREKFGLVDQRNVVLTWAYHPKPLPMAVPNSFALAAAQFGMNLTIACPPEYDLDDDLIATIQAEAKQNGSTVRVLHDQKEACRGADIIYAKSWGNKNYYGRLDEEVALRRNYREWIVNDDIMNLTSNGYFMHCLPVRRNVVVTDSVLDGDRSIVVAQAENRLHVQKAILSLILGTGNNG
jgi:N-acetylornithine carbamoyltransferase